MTDKRPTIRDPIPPDEMVDIIGTAEDIDNPDVGREIAALLDDFAQDKDHNSAMVRVLAVMAGSLQRIAERLDEITTHGIPR